MSLLDKIRRVGWLAIEIGLILVVLAVLLRTILGGAAGEPVTAISDNAIAFLQALPQGTIVGLAAIGVLYLLLRSRKKA